MRKIAILMVALDGHPVDVYEYGTRHERRQWSRGINPDGSGVVNTDGRAFSVARAGNPHFYARGRILVLALSACPSLGTRGSGDLEASILDRGLHLLVGHGTVDLN